MTKLILHIYDFFRKRPFVAWSIFIVSTVALVLSVLTLNYKEDISDFLPLDVDNQTALQVYQDISGANRIYAIVSARSETEADSLTEPNPDILVAGIDAFVENVENADSLHYLSTITKTVDMESMMSVADNVYENIPYFLTDSDYERIDSLLSQPGYVAQQVEEDKQILMFPASGVTGQNISRDPLNLFTPILSRMSQGGMPIRFESYDGYILSPDSRKAIVILESSFGAHESEHNADLVSMLNSAVEQTAVSNPDVDIHIIGGPVIAVSNAGQIKNDSMVAVCIAGVLILLLLIYVFRNVWNILLIVVSVGWGWLFAMGGIALYYDSVSIIVIGIASVILGIAVNYPLHLIDHLKDSLHPRAALKEIISPLIVGNVTTVGAFLCLVPLNAPALHDLGLFSSLLLVGTILFVLLFLPHAIKISKRHSAYNPKLITRLAEVSIDSNRYVVWAILLLTCVFGYFSLRTEFDSDMRNINYMTPSQRSDMEYFQSLIGNDKDTESMYIVSNGDDWEAAQQQNEIVNKSIDSLETTGLARRHNAVSSFLSSKAVQKEKIAKWKAMTDKYNSLFADSLPQVASKAGFSVEAFDSFNEIISVDYEPKEFTEFEELVSTVFAGNVSQDESTGRHSLVQTIEVPIDKVDEVKERIASNREFDGLFFDVKSMNGAIANTLSDDFNYIGFACGCIVFLFLWLSFGSIELAIVSFLPMAVSWIWILGIMGVLGIKFNIVNVILATFIFGQGDDYTIFMTEGLTYEFAYRKKLLASYKNSIIVSALIMFIGIGTLIFAKHPALRSLGEVTVVGMLSVVLMAYLFPPLVFNWLVKSHGEVRPRPITLKKILCTGFCAATFFTQLTFGSILGFFMFELTKPTPKKRLLFHKLTCSVFRFDIKRMPGIRSRLVNVDNKKFEKPAMIICNHQSLLDSFCMMVLSPKVILIANEHISKNPVVRRVFKWSNFLSVSEGAETLIEKLRPLVAQGYSVAMFPEGARAGSSREHVMRFHKGAFHIANELSLDIVPVYFFGLTNIMPKGSALSNGGTLYIEVGKRIAHSRVKEIGDAAVQAKCFRNHYRERITEITGQLMTPDEARGIVFDRYIYKGRDIEVNAKKTIRVVINNASKFTGLGGSRRFRVDDRVSNGELALMLAVMYPEAEIECRLATDDARRIFEGCLTNFANNVKITDEFETAGESSKMFITCDVDTELGSDVDGAIIIRI